MQQWSWAQSRKKIQDHVMWNYSLADELKELSENTVFERSELRIQKMELNNFLNRRINTWKGFRSANKTKMSQAVSVHHTAFNLASRDLHEFKFCTHISFLCSLFVTMIHYDDDNPCVWISFLQTWTFEMWYWIVWSSQRDDSDLGPKIEKNRTMWCEITLLQMSWKNCQRTPFVKGVN